MVFSIGQDIHLLIILLHLQHVHLPPPARAVPGDPDQHEYPGNSDAGYRQRTHPLHGHYLRGLLHTWLTELNRRHSEALISSKV